MTVPLTEQLQYQDIQPSDVLLAIVAAAGKPIDLAQLQKATFLISEEFGQELVNFYTFRKYNYGPFCQSIYSDLEMLHGLGFIRIKEGKQKTYSTAHQLDFENFNLPDDLKHHIKETVIWVIVMSFNELLNAIYYLFPEYHENSLFNYSEEDAMVESFGRALREGQDGNTYDAKSRLKELSRVYA